MRFLFISTVVIILAVMTSSLLRRELRRRPFRTLVEMIMSIFV